MLIRLKPIFMERLWGGRNLEQFGYTLPDGNIGEAWCISGHKAGSSLVVNEEFLGMNLRQLYEQRRDLFANDQSEEFPLLVKILDAQQDLSIQIHPDDAYAKVHENSYGKTECWYVLDAAKDGKLIIGHNGSVDDVKEAIDRKDWDRVLRYETVKKGDFFFVPAGTIHAICHDTIIYEVQQSSDMTYRLYDYDRLESGKLRDLHTKQAMDVLKPFEQEAISTKQQIYSDEYYTHNQLVDCPFFSVNQYTLNSEVCTLTVENPTYSLCSVFNGEVVVNCEVFKHGEHFICSSQSPLMEISGVGQLFITQAKIM